MIEIAPSILSANFSKLARKSHRRRRALPASVDVMDGRFVPNITVGLPVVKAISRATRLPIDAHLMIVEPGRYAESS
jgi:ribulose-phosphate 3-epimerase